VSKFLDISAK